MSQYELFFKEADKDGSGFLTLNELTTMLRSKGYTESDDKIKAMFGSVDMSGDNKISLDEYMVAMGQVPPKNHQEASMRAVFREFDKDGSGQVDAKELKEVMNKCGSNLSDQEVARLVQLIDKDGSGTVSYEEFISHVFGK